MKTKEECVHIYRTKCPNAERFHRNQKCASHEELVVYGNWPCMRQRSTDGGHFDMCEHLKRLSGTKDPFRFLPRQMYGCLWNILFEMADGFKSATFPLIVRGKPIVLTGSDLMRFMSGFTIISIHLRLGDRSLSGEATSVLSGEAKTWLDSIIACAMQIREGLKVHNLHSGREPMVYLASDTKAVRSYFVQQIPDTVLMLGIDPAHLSLIESSGQRDARLDPLMDMLLLSRGQHYILQIVGDYSTPNFKSPNLKRMSAFGLWPMFASLHDSHYEMPKCMLIRADKLGSFNESSCGKMESAKDPQIEPNWESTCSREREKCKMTRVAEHGLSPLTDDWAAFLKSGRY